MWRTEHQKRATIHLYLWQLLQVGFPETLTTLQTIAPPKSPLQKRFFQEKKSTPRFFRVTHFGSFIYSFKKQNYSSVKCDLHFGGSQRVTWRKLDPPAAAETPTLLRVGVAPLRPGAAWMCPGFTTWKRRRVGDFMVVMLGWVSHANAMNLRKFHQKLNGTESQRTPN